MIDYSLKNIQKRSLRSTLTILGIAVLITLVIVITGIVNFQKKTMHEHASAGGAGRLIVQSKMSGNNYPAKFIDFDENTGKQIVGLENIQHAISGNILFYELMPPLFPNNPPELLFAGVERGKEQCFTGNIVNLTRAQNGKSSFIGETTGRPVILGNKAKEYFEKQQGTLINVGSAIAIESKQYNVIGILCKSSDIIVNNSVIIPLDLLQKEINKCNQVSSVIVYLTDLKAKESVLSKIKVLCENTSILSTDSLLQNANEGIKLFEKLINGISSIVVLAAILLILTVMMVTINERTKEIGILRAIGTSKAKVIQIIIVEIFILSLAGSLLGCLFSGFILKYGLMEDLFDLLHILSFIPLCVLITLIAGIAPVLRVTKISPLESLRYE